MDPDLEMQGIIINRLRADPSVAALVGERVFDTVQGEQPQFPYVTYGPSDMTSTDPECYDTFALIVQLDIWSRKPGFPESKRIANAIRVCLHNKDEEMQAQMTSNALVFFQHRQTQTMRDPDGLTNHAVVIFEASVERH